MKQAEVELDEAVKIRIDEIPPWCAKMAHELFISYSTKDKLIAESVCAGLEAHNIPCWIAPRDILHGMDWAASIVDALNRSQAVVLILSSHSNASVQVKREVQCAFETGLAVIPFRIEAIEPSKSLSYYLRSVQWLDALDPPLQQHVDHLAKTVEVLLSPDAVQLPKRPKETPRETFRALSDLFQSGVKMIAMAISWAFLTVLLVLAIDGVRQRQPAEAMDARQGHTEVAARLAKRAQRLCDQQRYAEANEIYHEAIELDPRPEYYEGARYAYAKKHGFSRVTKLRPSE